jgi:hydrogenase assembly chaperone HypC/HupF
MCYAIPGLVTELIDDIATVEYFGEKKRVLADIDVKLGDYVYAQGGVIIDTIDKERAIIILQEWESQFARLQEVDKNNVKKENITFDEIRRKAEQGILSNNDMLQILKTNDTKNSMN